MKRIKDRLIRLLGGITYDGILESNYNSHEMGRLCALYDVARHMDSLYGKEADEWCKSSYAYVKQGIDDLLNTRYGIQET